MLNKIKNKFGIMQGRLLPKYKERYQAHPVDYWKNEFPIASELGLDSIEFILDYNDAEKNPLLTTGGLEDIQKIEKSTGVKVCSICADYFMEAPIHSDDTSVVDKSLKILDQLIKNASLINVTDIVVPCVDQSSLKSKKDINNFVNNIKMIASTFENAGINISLETDLAPLPFANLIDSIGSKNVTVNYDTGNSTALGYDPVEEFRSYGDKITDLHIKDRLFGSSSVALGTGDTNFSKIFDLLLKYDYKGIIIFQAFRDDEGVEIFKKQYNWFKKNYSIL
ncbi:sugar phosphate isomerase/epimerase [Candidatus Pelagibacter sp.]|nr:sugar phosphate isomerase/epimerase [Candidatus Pelagibacter sp.]MDC0992652.1 sugar phosphate isomerase/epimerase [Candidatus Pelagibacter sp.]